MPMGEIATRIVMTQNTKLGSRDHTRNIGIKPLPVKLVIFLFCFLKLHMTKICLKLVRPTLLLCKSVKKESSFRCHSSSQMAQTEPFNAYFVLLYNKSNHSLKNKSK